MMTLLFALSASALAADNTALVDLMDGISGPAAADNTYEGDADDWVFDLDNEVFTIDCSGFVSHMVYAAWFDGAGHTSIDIGGKAMLSPSYTMNAIAGAVNGNHGPFSSSWGNATADGFITVDGTVVPIDVRADIGDIEAGDVMTRSGHVALVEDLTRITDDFYILDVLHAVSSTGVKRSTYYLGVDYDSHGNAAFKYYSSSSKLRADNAYTGVRFASFAPPAP